MSQVGVLLVNLGTPHSTHPRSVKRYLIEFLTDRRVVDIPWISRQVIMRSLVIPRRFKHSAKLYASIWTDKGSPLKVYGQSVKERLSSVLGSSFQVELAMRYQTPSIQEGLNRLRGVSHLLILPLFPQYASATTGSIYESIFNIIRKWHVIPGLTCIDQFATHPSVIAAFCAKIRAFDLDRYDHIVFSYHGLPERQIKRADPHGMCLSRQACCERKSPSNRHCYAAQCVAMTKKIASQLNLDACHYTLSYQSRFGKDPWLKPYTGTILKQLATYGQKVVLVVCPAFVCDCLETLYEIQVEYAEAFKQYGGERLDLVKGLNDHPMWIEALKELVLDHLPRHVAFQTK